MPLTGEINDLSLSEVIELFCNRRRTGRLTVAYPQGTAQIYLEPGTIVHALFDDLKGIEAFHYALTLTNASFTFQPEVEAPDRSIDQPWTSVVLDGLRRIDEGFVPLRQSSNGGRKVQLRYVPADQANHQSSSPQATTNDVQAFGVLLSQFPESAPPRRWVNLPLLVAIILIVLGVGVPWGWYTRHKASQIRRQADNKFEHLYAPSQPVAQPGADAATNDALKTTVADNSEKKTTRQGEKASQPGSSP